MLVFLRALISYLRDRDPLGRDVMLVFSALASLFVLQVLRLFTEPPPVLQTLGTLLLLGQPFLTLRLVSRLRRVSGLVMLGALIAYLATALPLVAVGRPAPVPLTLAAVAVFVVTDALAAWYLASEARRRHGAGRVRLTIASISTALLAAAILAAGAGAAASEAAALASGVARAVALLAAVGYLLAFLPPAWLRRSWHAAATVHFSEWLLAIPHSEPAATIWDGLASAAPAIGGADLAAVLIERPDGTVAVAAIAGDSGPVPDGGSYAIDDFRALINVGAGSAEQQVAKGGSIVESFAQVSGSRYFSLVPLSLEHGRQAAILMLSRYRSLFRADDRTLLAGLGAQATLLAQRQETLAEQARLSNQLSDTVEALKGANAAKSDFLASMSHELRTPLSAIVGFSELMRDEPRNGGSVAVPAEWVEHIHRSGEHLVGIINDVLDLSKVDAGRIELRREEFDLHAVVGDVIAELRPLVERKRLALGSSLEVGRLVADRGRFRQMLYNLLSNAIKFTEPGGEVRVESQENGGDILVSVSDTGIGIAAKHHVAVFEEFRQMSAGTAAETGTGLGLALTRRLVEAHGGRVQLESEPGRGSRFTLVFPQPGITRPNQARPAETAGASVGAPPAVSPASPASPAASASAAASATPMPTDEGDVDVLVVEDDPGGVRLHRTYLEAAGYRVRVAPDGQTALAEARRMPPSAIVLDILLPGMDGWSVLRELNADVALRDIPVIIVTVVDEPEVGRALGAVDYIVKPIDREALIAGLRRNIRPDAGVAQPAQNAGHRAGAVDR